MSADNTLAPSCDATSASGGVDIGDPTSADATGADATGADLTGADTIGGEAVAADLPAETIGEEGGSTGDPSAEL